MDDTLIRLYIDAAVEAVENYTGRIIKQRSLTKELSCFSTVMIVDTPLVSVESIIYLDSSGNSQTLQASIYRVTLGMDGFISLAPAQSWPTLSSENPLITVNYTAGYLLSNLPRSVFIAIMAKVSDFYENRESHSFIKEEHRDKAFYSLLSDIRKRSF